LSTKFSSWFEQSSSTTHDSFAKCCPTNFDYQAFEIVGVATLFLNRGGLKECPLPLEILVNARCDTLSEQRWFERSYAWVKRGKQNVAKLLLSRGGLKETTAFQAGVNSVETVFLSKEDICCDSPPFIEKSS
jgi:hypothetical protein